MNRRPTPRCTWAYIQESASRQAIQALKASGSKEIEDYIETFDKENKAKDQRLEDAENEIQRLRNELRKNESRTSTTSGILLRHGRERDLYQNETLSTLLDAIKDAATRIPDDYRRQHILKSILEANKLSPNPL